MKGTFDHEITNKKWVEYERKKGGHVNLSRSRLLFQEGEDRTQEMFLLRFQNIRDYSVYAEVWDKGNSVER